MRNIPFSPPDITELEIQEVCEALRSGWITTGPRTKQLEKELAEYCHVAKLVCLNSATAAEEMNLRVLGIGEGDEVLVPAYTYTATEIKDNNTTFINRHSVDLDIHQGLMIDVIPLDAVPKSKWKQLWQMADSMMYCCFNFQRLPAHKGKVTYYAEKLALTLVPSFKARYKLWKGAEKRLSRYSLADAEYVSSFGEGATIMRQRFPIRWFRHPAYLEFEGHQMPVPEDYDKWLTISYGDYMQLPPPEERVYRHDAVFIDLEHSYKQYKGIHYCVDEKKA